MEIYELVSTSNYEGRGGQGLTVCVTDIYKKNQFHWWVEKEKYI